MRLDLGAVAKGYATEIVARELIDKGYDSFAISGGECKDRWKASGREKEQVEHWHTKPWRESAYPRPRPARPGICFGHVGGQQRGLSKVLRGR